jgi:hypothetical protein
MERVQVADGGRAHLELGVTMFDPQGPFSRRFWLGDTDPRPLAALRIGLGSILLFQLADLWPDAGTFFSDTGISHRAAPTLAAISLFNAIGDAFAIRIVLAVYAVALVLFTLGLYTRFVNVVVWMVKVSLHHRMASIFSGGDFLLEVTLFLLMFGQPSACWSLDSRRSGSVATAVPAFPLRALQVHLALLYFVSARSKLAGTWRTGDGISLSLEALGFTRPPGAWLYAHPDLCRISTYVILGFELSFAFFALSPFFTRRAQLIAAGIGAAVQLGIMTTMRVGPFTLTMLTMSVLFVPADVWDRFPRLRLPLQGAPPAPVSPWRRRLALGITAMVVFSNVDNALLMKRLPMPAAGTKLAGALGLPLAYALFDQPYELASYQALVRRSDGTEVDVAPAIAPALAASVVGWNFSSWYKLSFSAQNLEPGTFARFFCRASSEAGAVKDPVFITLIRNWRLQHLPKAPAHPAMHTVLWQGPCAP